MKPRENRRRDPDPAELSSECLMTALAACEQSRHYSDRCFAADCKAELERRLTQPRLSRPDPATWVTPLEAA